MEKLQVTLGFDNCMVVDSIGKSGGLALLWLSEVCLEVVSFSNQHIDSKISDSASEEGWRFTGFYGNPVVGDRWKSWNILRRLSESQTLPWLCAGDFNEILYDNEKMGGALRATKQMEDFRTVLHECNLQEVPYSGPKFTWSRGKGPDMILERLDRGLASEDWLHKFQGACEKHLVAIQSDHCPLLFYVAKSLPNKGRKGGHFKFENMWVRHKDCEEVVKK